MSFPIALKLDCFVKLAANDHCALEKLMDDERQIMARVDLPNDRFHSGPHFLTSGYAFQSTMLRDGRRQITCLLLPGDEFINRPGYEITALTDACVVKIPDALLERHPAIDEALDLSAHVNEAILREHVISLGARSAGERIAHMLCEWFVRSRRVKLTDKTSCPFPLNQKQIGSHMGLSLVHTNRSLQMLRDENLIRIEGRKLTILDLPGLKAAGYFQPGYLSYKPEKATTAPKRRSVKGRDGFSTPPA